MDKKSVSLFKHFYCAPDLEALKQAWVATAISSPGHYLILDQTTPGKDSLVNSQCMPAVSGEVGMAELLAARSASIVVFGPFEEEELDKAIELLKSSGYDFDMRVLHKGAY